MPQVWDPYSVLAPTCHSNDVDIDAAVVQNTPFLGQLREQYNISTSYNPCINTYTPKYMNKPEVIKVTLPMACAMIFATDRHDADASSTCPGVARLPTLSALTDLSCRL